MMHSLFSIRPVSDPQSVDIAHHSKSLIQYAVCLSVCSPYAKVLIVVLEDEEETRGGGESHWPIPAIWRFR